MALGGGVFTATNKILPGIYHNFISVAKSSATMTERGTAAVPYVGDWGEEEKVLLVTAEDFWKNSESIFGFPAEHSKSVIWRELFKSANKAYVCRMGTGAKKAVNAYCTAVFGGTRGNALKTVIRANVDDITSYDVLTYLDSAMVDTQTVHEFAKLVPNDFVTWKTGGVLQAEAGAALTGGENSTELTAANYQSFLGKMESYAFNALCCPADDSAIKQLFVEFTRRMRQETGAKFQTVLFQHPQADYEGVVSLENEVSDNAVGKSGLLYWTTGAIAGCPVNESNTNRKYDGELDVQVDYTQVELAAALKAGKFMLHNVSGEIRVLEDINTLTSFTAEKNTDFASNQTIRVLDQIANDTAAIFAGKYLGKVPNDAAGRTSLWADILRNRQQLQDMRAIEDYDKDALVIEQAGKKQVVARETVQVVNAMAQLYMTTTIE